MCFDAVRLNSSWGYGKQIEEENIGRKYIQNTTGKILVNICTYVTLYDILYIFYRILSTIIFYCIALYHITLQGVLTDVNLDYSIACLFFFAVELRIFRPPQGTRGFENLTAIDCSKCLPTCHNSRYALDYSYADDGNLYAKNCGGYLDVFYKDLSAIKYRQEMAFDFMDLVG